MKLYRKKHMYKYKKTLLVLSISAVTFFFYLILVPLNINDNYYFEIENGDNVNTVAKKLESEDMIRSTTLFKILITQQLGSKKLAYGKYNIKKYRLGAENINMLGIIDILVNKKNYTPGYALIIPEGFTLEEISARVAKVFNIPYNDFYDYAKSKNGYLYPETYYFPQNVTKEEIVEKMLSEFEKGVGIISKEDLVLASIIEGEGKNSEDMKMISGILRNRMKIGMALQVDVAPSTYKSRDLPKEPINNPGPMAIEAVRNPTKSKYLYYITGNDGNFYYTESYEEHKKNIQKYLKN